MTLPRPLQALLEKHEIPLRILAHPRTYTSRGAARATGVRADHLAKGVLLKDHTGYLLAVIPADQWVRLGAVSKSIGRNRSLAPEQDIGAVFPDCDPGAAPPLGPAFGLSTIVDESLTSLADVYLEAGDHDQLIHLKGVEFQELMRGARVGHFARPG